MSFFFQVHVDRKMEENLGTVNARHLIVGEHDAVRPCALFLTRSRIIVASPKGINLWTALAAIVALIASFIGLLLRNFVLFLGGLGIGITAGLLVVIIDSFIRQRQLSKMKKFTPERILEMNKENFEIRYAEIAKVEVRTFKTYPKGSYFLPTLQELAYSIDFITDEKKHIFILDKGDLLQCLDLLRRFAPKTIEIEEVEADDY